MLDIQTDNAVPAPKPITDSRSKNAGFTPEVRKGLLGLGLGNALEWYDWMVFGLLSAFIGPNFFPGTEPLSATLNALAVFAVGFAFRPLGGILLEVRKTFTEATEAANRVTAMEKGEKAGKAWISAVAQNFAVGLAEARDLSDALVAFFGMRTRYLQAVFDLHVARSALTRAVGSAEL